MSRHVHTVRHYAPREANYDHLVKLLLLGDSAVGKSSLLMRFCEQRFDNSFVLTIGVDFKTKVVQSGDKKLKLQVWDTAGQERFRTITPAYFRSAMGVVLTYDVTNATTFANLRRWMKNVEDYTDANVQIILIGNKCDLENKREIPRQKGEDLAAEYSMPFFESSAKQNLNVDAAFLCIADLVREARFPSQPLLDSESTTGNTTASSGTTFRLSDTNSGLSVSRRRCCHGLPLGPPSRRTKENEGGGREPPWN
eukprot:GHVS01055947.1.p1 GENE.GHVS01055947.1~~GHVS01055947.1.p1  ORF type:complete len:253 (-),score=33.60 GHVS01055947.1:282-1040(-)